MALTRLKDLPGKHFFEFYLTYELFFQQRQGAVSSLRRWLDNKRHSYLLLQPLTQIVRTCDNKRHSYLLLQPLTQIVRTYADKEEALYSVSSAHAQCCRLLMAAG